MHIYLDMFKAVLKDVWIPDICDALRLAQAKNRGISDKITPEMVADEYVLAYYNDRLKELR